MDAGWVVAIITGMGSVASIIKLYIDKITLKSDVERYKEKIEELKEWIRNAK